jgi:hypothetical protein
VEKEHIGSNPASRGYSRDKYLHLQALVFGKIIGLIPRLGQHLK